MTPAESVPEMTHAERDAMRDAVKASLMLAPKASDRAFEAAAKKGT